MTDHPMSCYPGHLEPWRSAKSVLPRDMPVDEWAIYSAQAHIARVSEVVQATDRAIYRAMSGQITSSTGYKI